MELDLEHPISDTYSVGETDFLGSDSEGEDLFLDQRDTETEEEEEEQKPNQVCILVSHCVGQKVERPSHYMSSVAASCRVILGWCYTQTQHSTLRSCPTPGSQLSYTLSTVLRMVKQHERAITAVPHQEHNSVASSDNRPAVCLLQT